MSNAPRGAHARAQRTRRLAAALALATTLPPAVGVAQAVRREGAAPTRAAPTRAAASVAGRDPRFDWFEYEGRDRRWPYRSGRGSTATRSCRGSTPTRA
jgi:hypothetical protein